VTGSVWHMQCRPTCGRRRTTTPYGLIEAVCGRVVYPLRVAEAGARRCQQCSEKLPPFTSGDVR
jgi:hypothetical protein